MSGAEVIAVLVLVGQCWGPLKGVLKLTRDICEKARSFKEEYDGISTQFRNLQTVLATLQLVLQRVEQRSKTELFDLADRLSLSEILCNCKASMEDLDVLFREHYLPDQDGTIAKFRRAVHILASKPELASIQGQIDRYISAITAHSSAFAPTAQEISCVIASDLEKIFDRRWDRLESLLKVKTCF
jgi:N-terminal domain on NACHT_NTPase and P-loop NTPases